MKNMISIVLAAVLLFALAIPTAAADKMSTEKEEVVYGILGLDGSVENIYVVNIFNTGSVSDYGDYTEVGNLTNADPVKQNGDEITIDSSAARLYYQGTLRTRELPWSVAVTYTLDGKEITASELVGASGALSIRVLVTQNPNVDSIFFDNYALQVALSLDTELCENINADGATVADAGTDKQLSYIVLPGKGTDFTVSADVHNFEMDAMTFNGIKLALSMDIDDTEFSEQIGTLASAISGLDDGALSLLNGVSKLKDGMSKYMSGFSAYNNGLADLTNGASQLASGISGLDSGLKGLVSQSDSLVAGATSIEQTTFSSVNVQLSGRSLPELTPDNYSAILSGNANLAGVKTQLDNVVQFTRGIVAYTSGVSQLQTGTSSLSLGATQLSSSLSQVASGAQQLYDGASGLNSAIGSLNEGLTKYKAGSSKLRSGTANMSSEISDQIDKLLSGISGGDEVKSFVSEKNTDVTSVQFVIRTDSIQIPTPDNTATVQGTQLGFWAKLLALFGIN